MNIEVSIVVSLDINSNDNVQQLKQRMKQSENLEICKQFFVDNCAKLFDLNWDEYVGGEVLDIEFEKEEE